MRAAIACACAVALGGCGEAADRGPALEWVGTPTIVASAAGDARILQGEVRNRSGEPLRVAVADVVLRDAGGDEVAGNALFAPGYVRPGEPQNRGGEPFADSEAERIGRLLRVGPGETSPLFVSWRVRDGDPVAIHFPGGELAVPDR